MQFLYADGTDAHFMDSRDLRAARDPRERGGGDAEVGPAQRGRRPAVHRRRAGATSSSTRPSSSRSRTPSRACAATRPAAAARSRRRSRRARWSTCRCSSTSATASRWTRARGSLHVARVSRARTEQRRAAVFALYQARGRRAGSSTTASSATRPASRARSRTRRSDHREELDAVISAHAKGWTLERIAPLEKAIMRVALLEMLHPDVVGRRHADPARGRHRRGGGDREGLLRRGGAGLRQRDPRRDPARRATQLGGDELGVLVVRAAHEDAVRAPRRRRPCGAAPAE